MEEIPVPRMKTTAEMNWVLKRWEELNLPWWQRIYKEAIEVHDLSRAEYAQNILKILGEIK